MKCPICENPLNNCDDSNVLLTIFNFFSDHMNPLAIRKSLFNLTKGMSRVIKILYYDFSSIAKVDEYLWCSHCQIYFLQCSMCGRLNTIGSKIVSPTKVKCIGCEKEFVYIAPTHAEEGGMPTV